VFQQAKTFRALDRVATVIGKNIENIAERRKWFQCKVHLLPILAQDQEY
jgi:hypothetical protein